MSDSTASTHANVSDAKKEDILCNIVRVVRSRANARHHGIVEDGDLLLGVFQQLLLKRGHYMPAHDNLLPDAWRTSTIPSASTKNPLEDNYQTTKNCLTGFMLIGAAVCNG